MFEFILGAVALIIETVVSIAYLCFVVVILYRSFFVEESYNIADSFDPRFKNLFK